MNSNEETVNDDNGKVIINDNEDKKVDEEEGKSEKREEERRNFFVNFFVRSILTLLYLFLFVLKTFWQVLYSLFVIFFTICVTIGLYFSNLKSSGAVWKEMYYEQNQEVIESVFNTYLTSDTFYIIEHESFNIANRYKLLDSIREVELRFLLNIKKLVINLLEDETIFLEKPILASWNNFSSNSSKSQFIRKLICENSKNEICEDLPLITLYERPFRKLLLLKLFIHGDANDLLVAIEKIREIFPDNPHEVSLIIDQEFLSQLPLSKALSFPYSPVRLNALQKISIVLFHGSFNLYAIKEMICIGRWREQIFHDNIAGQIATNHSLSHEFLSIEVKKIIAKKFINAAIAEKRKVYSIVQIIIRKVKKQNIELLSNNAIKELEL